MNFTPPAIPVIAIVGGFVTALLYAGIYFTYCAWRASQEMSLKREMIDRGFSAAEIVAVISARGTGEGQASTPADMPMPKATANQQP